MTQEISMELSTMRGEQDQEMGGSFKFNGQEACYGSFHSTLPIPPVLEPPCETSNMLGPPLPRCALCNHQVDFLHTSGTLGTRERSHTWLLRCNHFIDPGCLGVIARPENGRVCCWPYFLFVIQGPNRNYSSYSESIISSNSNLPPVPT